MFLTQLQLRNWRSYRNATFTLPAPDRTGKRNVILIGAQNGVGKTSFLVALYLGLFGREAMSMVEGFRASVVADDRLLSYQKLIEGILHRPARAAMIRIARLGSPLWWTRARSDSAQVDVSPGRKSS